MERVPYVQVSLNSVWADNPPAALYFDILDPPPAPITIEYVTARRPPPPIPPLPVPGLAKKRRYILEKRWKGPAHTTPGGDGPHE